MTAKDAEDAVVERLARVRESIDRAATRAGRRPEQVVLVGVAKRHPAELVAAAVRAGLRNVGENYYQEARDKIPKVQGILEACGVPCPRWHFVGRLQRNKARSVVGRFDVVQAVDRESLGQELNRRAAQDDRSLEVLLEVNLSGEAGKGGASPEALRSLLAASAGWSHLTVSGLMTLPRASDDPESARPVFARLRRLSESLRSEAGGQDLRELSMGMSADFEIAIEEGATIVRIGTAIFGPRSEKE